jgi:hypothetical protein
MDDIVVVERGGRKIVRCRLWGSANTGILVCGVRSGLLILNLT